MKNDLSTYFRLIPVNSFISDYFRLILFKFANHIYLMNTSTKFLSKKELANQFNISVKTLKVWIDKIKDGIPFYVEGQRLFAPKQVNAINTLLGA